MKEQRLTDPKLSKCGTYTERLLKLGNRVYGHIRKPVGVIAPGAPRELTYWARRTEEQSFRKDNSWAIDRATITLVRTEMVTHIGVLLEDGTTYRTPISHFSDAFMGTIRERDYSNKGGARQWYLPFEYWEKTEPPPAARAALIAKKMHIARSRASAAAGSSASA